MCVVKCFCYATAAHNGKCLVYFQQRFITCNIFYYIALKAAFVLFCICGNVCVSLTWLLGRQGQLWVQVWTVVCIYPAFILLSPATNPVQTNTCRQRQVGEPCKYTVDSSFTAAHQGKKNNKNATFLSIKVGMRKGKQEEDEELSV